MHFYVQCLVSVIKVKIVIQHMRFRTNTNTQLVKKGGLTTYILTQQLTAHISKQTFLNIVRCGHSLK